MQTKSVLSGKTINLTSDNTTIKSTNFNVDKDGNMTCNNANVTGGKLQLTSTTIIPKITIDGQEGKYPYVNYLYSTGIKVKRNDNDLIKLSTVTDGSNSWGSLTLKDYNETHATNLDYSFIFSPMIKTDHFIQTSIEEKKKNFEKLQNNALEIIKNIDIYKYNLKDEKDTDKKHIGFVIGDKYNYSKEVTSIDNQGVDNYSFTSLCCKAIQELLEKNNELIKRIEKLEKTR